jgi:hypothetical protein
MQGFTNNVPISVAVSWIKNPDGTYQPIPLKNAEAFDFGLLAETFNAGNGITTRWFVPWTSVVYIQQDQPPPVPATEPTHPAPPAPPTPDPKP